jgi:hypothetical protein
MRKLVLTCIAALAVAAPAYGEDGEGEKPREKVRELRISGPIVRISQQAVTVENRVGDAVLTCLVPERLTGKLTAFAVGDKVRMLCLRHRGRRAQLVKLLPLEARKRSEKAPEKPETPVEKQEAAGPIVELGESGIVVQGERRLACRVPAEKLAKLSGLKVGDTVKILCAGGVLVGLERPAAADKPKPVEELRLYGRIAELSREAVTVRGDAGSLTCRAPEWLAEKLARFAVGDSVKMMCRGTELTYLEKTG